jgi:hypothetical protein
MFLVCVAKVYRRLDVRILTPVAGPDEPDRRERSSS